MKRIIILIALFAALGTTDSLAQYRQEPTIWGSNDNTVYRDDRGEYRWEMRERRVWIPEYYTRGIFGVGSRRVPGHYEMRRERVKVYLDNDRNYKKNKKGHPHGMPPGQRKKQGKYDDRYDRNDRYETDRRRNDERYERDRDYDNRSRGDRDDDDNRD